MYDLDDRAHIWIGRDPSRKRLLDIQPRKTLLGGRRRIILVHGFSSRPRDALKTYEKFVEGLRRVAPRLAEDTRTLTWPSGGRWQYQDALRLAKSEASVVLAEHIWNTLKAPTGRLILVGHSLGCRLLLEALHRLPARGRREALARVSVLLMAPAVPTSLVEGAHPMRETVDGCSRAKVFFSHNDEALGLIFTLAQGAEDGADAKAIGLKGEPEDFWGKHRAQHMKGFAHGSYWEEAEMALALAESLRAVQHRPLAARRLGGRAPSVREADRHQPATRTIGGRSG